MTVALVIIGVVVLVLLISPIVSYNRFVRQRNLVAESWRQIDVELQRRHDLIPNLVETVQGYAAHERQVFDDITRARAAAVQARSTAENDQAHARDRRERVEQGRGRCRRTCRGIPAAQGEPEFPCTCSTNSSTPKTASRPDAASTTATSARSTPASEAFPSNIVAGMFHFSAADYFELDDPGARQAVSVDLGGGSR